MNYRMSDSAPLCALIILGAGFGFVALTIYGLSNFF